MKTLIVMLAALFFFGTVSEARATATWKHFGADKAYVTREAAIADTSRVLRKVGWPEPVIRELAAKMQQAGDKAHVVNGNRLTFMRSGKSAIWRNVLVAFDKPPIKDAMEYSAPSEEWSVIWHDVVWTVGIPDVCRNLYGKTRAALKPKIIRKTRIIKEAPQCAREHIHIPAGRGRIVRGVILGQSPITDFNCWGITAGQYRQGGLSNCDSCDWTGEPIAVMRKHGYGDVKAFNTFIFYIPEDATSGNSDGSLDATIFLPRAATKMGNGVCVEVAGQTYPAATILPPSWKRYEVEVPLDFWTHPRVISP